MRTVHSLAVVAAVALVAAAVPAQILQHRTWSVVAGGPEGMRYSTLRQINTSNVARLKQLWRFDSGDEYEGSEMQCNPIVVGDVLYATTPRLRVVALDAATGKLRWDFDAHRGEQVRGKQRNRGLVYWHDGTSGRLFVGVDEYLYALDADTGRPVAEFGQNGRVDLRQGLGRPANGVTIRANTPGIIYRDLLILGTLVSEDLPAAPGHIRAFDVRTGQVRWTFHTIPQPGEPGHETWPPDAYTRTGGANSWAGLALDEQRGLVFIPTGSAAFDFYGADRHGDNLYANSLLALQAATGKRVWHHQFVRHDVWDRDLPAPPTLVQVRRQGKLIDAVAQITKSGHVYVFDRETGRSLFPLREIAVPASDVEGERLARKQVLPVAPPPFARQQLTADLLTNRTRRAKQAVREQFLKLRSGPQFTPPSKQGTIVFPGYDGGGEWGGTAWDPETGLLYINANEMAWILRLVPRTRQGVVTGKSLYLQHCSGCHRPDLQGTPPEFPALAGISRQRTREQIAAVIGKGAGRMPGFAHLGAPATEAILRFVADGEDPHVTNVQGNSANTLKYRTDGYNKFLDPDGYPAVAPPWGTLNALNLHTGRYAWRIPFGEFPQLAAQGLRHTGSENYGGGVVTKGGLLFIGATNHDNKFRAFDKLSGRLLWQADLPAAGNATPAVFEVHGKQMVVIGAGGGKSGAKSGGSYVAFGLD